MVRDDSPCLAGHNTPFPLERSPPASFKRLLGGNVSLATLSPPLSPSFNERGYPKESIVPLNEAAWLLWRSVTANADIDGLMGLGR